MYYFKKKAIKDIRAIRKKLDMDLHSVLNDATVLFIKVLNNCYIGGCSNAFKSPKYTVGEVTKATHKCEREELREGRRGK